MKNSVKEINKILSANIAEQNVINFKTLITKYEDDCFITIKDISKMQEDETVANFYQVEITPINDFYNITCKVLKDFSNISYQIHISLENGLEANVPYYVNLFLGLKDINGNQAVLTDEEILKSAFMEGSISKKDYNFAYKIANKLTEEITHCRNKYLNIDIVDFIKKTKML